MTTERINRQRLEKLLQRMVDIYSPSGKEGDLLDFLKGYLKRRNLPVVIQEVDEDRYNIILAPTDEDLQLAFIGHIDTVSAPDLDNYGYTIQGDRIKGLGAADMKGGCAAMIEAFITFREAGNTKAPVAICLVVGEEESGDGAEKLMKSYHFPWAIIAEPTDLVPCLQSYGYVEILLSARGTRQHASLAKRRHNATEVMLQTLLRLTQHLETSYPLITYNIRDLFSSQSGFAVPERCEACLDLHLPPGMEAGEILLDMEEIALSKKDIRTGIEMGFRTATIAAGYQFPEKGVVVDSLKNVFKTHNLPWSTDAFRSHSDANQIWTSGVKPIILGPGQLEQAHAHDESVSFQQIVEAAEIYLSLMEAAVPDGEGATLPDP
ncbi:MAG: M20/M25/M40 family metallo-hydrolase [Proteobacteria bacterium]|nr:M20/M25/M40 family metallo-hydrolase [Pseudomonadota bacterium]MBU1739749.1 M20/M25/M40 family metallo-hydrolase [Pseudomonadota bacterium]